jgi:gas vesicle protein
MTPGKILAGVVFGAAFAAVLGMIFAPAKESVTRKRIAGVDTEYDEMEWL